MSEQEIIEAIDYLESKRNEGDLSQDNQDELEGLYELLDEQR